MERPCVLTYVECRLCVYLKRWAHVCGLLSAGMHCKIVWLGLTSMHVTDVVWHSGIANNTSTCVNRRLHIVL